MVKEKVKSVAVWIDDDDGPFQLFMVVPEATTESELMMGPAHFNWLAECPSPQQAEIVARALNVVTFPH